MYLIKSPFFLKWYYPSLLWHKSRSQKTIYLTFDDGPIPIVTPFVLKTLKNHNAKATFFCIGDNINKHPKEFAAVVQAGHSIGNHTFNHLKGWKTDDELYIENIVKAQALTQTNLFRPPYGRIKKSQIERLKVEGWKANGKKEEVGGRKSETGDEILKHYRQTKSSSFNPNPKPSSLHLPAINPIMWDVLSGDFDTDLSPETCYQNVIENTQNGSIIVFHDSLKAFERLEYALPRVMAYFTERGFRFEKL